MWTGTETEIELILIRHGKTRSNEEHRYLGKTDEELSESGKQQIRKERKKYPPCSIIFSSPLLRCIQTAEMIYPSKDLNIIEEWEEIDFGRFEGKNYKELEHDPDYIKWIKSNGSLPFPEGESREAFTERTEQGFFHMMKILMEKSKDKKRMKAAAVVHGGTIMTLCSLFDKGDYFNYQIKNAEGYRCILKCLEENIRLLTLERL